MSRHVIRIERFPGTETVFTIDGQPKRVVTGKVTPDVITYVYEDEEADPALPACDLGETAGSQVTLRQAAANLASARAGEDSKVSPEVAEAKDRLLNGLPLSTGQVAALAGVDPKTVANWIRAGKMEATQTPGGHYLVSAYEVKVKVLGAVAA
jgi:excisionase family DNA binding protein